MCLYITQRCNFLHFTELEACQRQVAGNWFQNPKPRRVVSVEIIGQNDR
jgi:hypothetical protein